MRASAGRGRAPVSRRGLLSAGLGLAAAALVPACSAPQAAPSSPSPAHRTPVPRREPNPDYQAIDGFIYAPDGSLFTPLGANVGTTSSFDWKGDARGHSDAALAWGWNTVRLNLMVTAAHSWSFVAQRSQADLLGLVRQIVDEYTGAGIVVILDAHDDPRADGIDRAATEDGMVAWWKLAGAAFKDNPRVWHGLINEPDYENAEWVELMDALAGAVRGTGNRAPVLVAPSGWGQDLGHTGPYFADAQFAYEPSMAPEVAKRHGNVILEQHNYGAFGTYSTPEKFGAYIETLRATGLTPLVGEFGYTVSKDKSPDVYDANYQAAGAVLEIAAERQVGALWWHATHGDNYSLMADGSAFWKSVDGNGLSDGGSRFWQFAHGRR
jgi:hypothetical protein